MKEKSYYLRKKEENENKIKELTNEIITLVENKDIEKVLLIKIKWKNLLDIERQLMLGDFIK